MNRFKFCMKYVDIENLDTLPGRRIKDGDSFSFHCYPGIACFNRCCRNLNAAILIFFYTPTMLYG